jgi:tRNA pseudouridine55 synthase
MATGLLVVLLGEGTKLSRWVMGCDKTYVARVALGQETDTLDAQGEVTREAPVPESALERAVVEEALQGFLGEQAQMPPIYSAIKRDGRTLMERARAGEVPEVSPRQVRCDELSLVAVEGSELLIRVACGSGYYVRSFARDLALKLDTVGHLSALTRERVGPWSLDDARPPAELAVKDVVEIADCLPQMEKVTLSDEDVENVRHGRRVSLDLESDEVMALEGSGQAVAMLSRDAEHEWRIERGFRL